MSKPCKACTEVPPIEGPSYQAKGDFHDYAGFNTYVVQGGDRADTGVVVVFDIFGMSSQAKQGADIVATHVPGHVVFVPDLFHGKPASKANYPPDTEEKKKVISAFFQGPADRAKNAQAVKDVVAALKKDEHYSGIKKWAIVGFCWGGKVATELASTSDLFQTSAQCHPAFLDSNDIEKLSIPHLILASKDEDKDMVSKCGEVLKKRNDKSYAKTYGESVHGWMGARANLENNDEKETFKSGYKDLVDFFAATL